MKKLVALALVVSTLFALTGIAAAEWGDIGGIKPKVGIARLSK